MSHAPERKEKNCLNCGTTVTGRYCHVCGQENKVPRESFGKLVIHFFYDITHFDGKFFETLKYLLFRPGFLSAEYMRGRRSSYLNPVRMYVFTSAIFFLIFFIVVDDDNVIKSDLDAPISNKQRMKLVKELETDLKNEKTDSLNLLKGIEMLKDTAKPMTIAELAKIDDRISFISITDVKYRTVKQYDSLQKLLPRSERDNWFRRTLIRRQTTINEKMRENPGQLRDKFGSILLHKLPYLLFVSLPIFALILKLLYIRRKQFYYADHAIFSIHHYICTFILLLFIFMFDALNNNINFKLFGYIEVAIFVLWPVYLYIAMRNFYKQGWFKTLVKFFLLNLLGLVALIVLLVIFFFFSVFQI